MGAIDGSIYHIRARMKTRWGREYERERYEESRERVTRIVAGFKGQGAVAVDVCQLTYATHGEPDLSFGDFYGDEEDEE